MRRKRAVLMLLLLVTSLVAGTGLWLRAQRRQYALNRALIAALVKGDNKQALALVNAGADPNTRYEQPPMPSLAEMVKQALHHTRPPTNNSLTAFLIACGANWMESAPFQQWIRTAIRQENRPDDPRLIETMLGHGAKVNERDKDYGNPPLQWAMMCKHHEGTIRVLLEQGADANAKGKFGVTPLAMAAPDLREGVMRLLLDHGADVHMRPETREPLLVSVVWRRLLPDTVRLLLAHGAPVNDTDWQGRTALYCAVDRMRLRFEADKARDIVRQLLAHRADPNLADNEGVTPLTLAHQYNLPDIVALLKRYGARK